MRYSDRAEGLEFLKLLVRSAADCNTLDEDGT